MKLLITGANGQLGNELRSIISTGVSEIGEIDTDDFYADYIDVAELDIADLEKVIEFVEIGGYDAIINCAAYTDVNGCETNIDTAMKVNAMGPRNLAIAAEKIGAKFLHVSTDYVFEGNGTRPYVEWDICAPQSVYGHSKHLGECYVKDFCTKYFIVRTSWLYGSVGNNFVRSIIRNGRKLGTLKVVNDQRGNPTNANDLAYHILKLISTQEYGVYHCTGNGECTWYDFACEIVDLAGVNCTVNPCTTDEYPTPAKRPAYSSLDNASLRCIGLDNMRDWKEALRTGIVKIIANGID